MDDLVDGQLIVDECHHLSAVSFEAVARRARARFVLGLSATVTRKDGHHPIIFMQCGPVRFRVDARSQAAQCTFSHRVLTRRTSFLLHPEPEQERRPIQQIYAALVADEARNTMIFNDVLQALEEKRSPVVLTERKDHALLLAEKISRFLGNVVVLTGGVGAKQRRAAMQRISDISATDERVLIAAGRYLGEGFGRFSDVANIMNIADFSEGQSGRSTFASLSLSSPRSLIARPSASSASETFIR